MVAVGRHHGVWVDSGEAIPSAIGVNDPWQLHQVIRRWQRIAQSQFREDCSALVQMIEETDQLRLWEREIGGFTFKDRDDFLQRKVLIDYELTEQDFARVLTAIRRGKPDAAAKVIRDAATVMAEAEPLMQHGEIGRGRADEDRPSDRRSIKAGENAAYLAARIKRDRPDIAHAVERGEYRSMRAAAIAADIIKPPTPCQRVLRLLPKLTAEDRETVRQALDEMEQP